MKASAAIIGFWLGASALVTAPKTEYSARPVDQRFHFTQVHMGVAVEITLYAASEEDAERAGRAAFARFEELDRVMSDYRRDSELERLMAKAGQGPQPVSPDLFRVLAQAHEVSQGSEGLFDVTAAPLTRLWRKARQSGMLPYYSEVEAAKKQVGWRHLVLDSRKQTADLELAGMQIDLGGIAKGDACDQAMAALRKEGIKRALIEAGGDMEASDPPPGKRGWTIAILGRSDQLEIANEAVSTSGDAAQYVEIGGRRFSHIIDPRTGFGMTDPIQATIIARSGLVTDPLATACCLLGPERSQPLLERFHARALFSGK